MRLKLLLTLSLLVLSTSVYGNGIDPKFYGDYEGLSTVAVRGDASLEDSIVRIKFDKTGLRLFRTAGRSEDEIHFSTEWLGDTELKDQEGFSLKQSTTGTLSKSIFVDTVYLLGAEGPAVLLEVLGEGMPVPLAIYLKGSNLELLKKIYDSERTDLVLSDEASAPPDSDCGSALASLAPKS